MLMLATYIALGLSAGILLPIMNGAGKFQYLKTWMNSDYSMIKPGDDYVNFWTRFFWGHLFLWPITLGFLSLPTIGFLVTKGNQIVTKKLESIGEKLK